MQIFTCRLQRCASSLASLPIWHGTPSEAGSTLQVEMLTGGCYTYNGCNGPSRLGERANSLSGLLEHHGKRLPNKLRLPTTGRSFSSKASIDDLGSRVPKKGMMPVRFTRNSNIHHHKAGPPLSEGSRAVCNNSGIRRPLIESSQGGVYFSRLVDKRFTLLRQKLRARLGDADTVFKSLGIKDVKAFDNWADQFQVRLRKAYVAGEKPSEKKVTNREDLALWKRLHESYSLRDIRGLHSELKYAFSSFVLRSQFSSSDIMNQKALADLRFPLEWFPATRSLQRKVYLHVGPTNSGKTYQALKRLEAADSGIYAGPLRLLAHEVYTRLNTVGKECVLVTGEEHRMPEGQDRSQSEQYISDIPMTSCTVEMVPQNSVVDVAVIDEIQMIGDLERGWAWTQAFLGVKAKELHLCGEVRTVPLIEDLCRMMGDTLEVHRYDRLSPLQTMNKSLKGNLKNLRKGDCIIVFSRVGIHAMKKEVENATGRRCAVVYGSLPPETRAQQANLFNDPDNEYDFLVASDAIGMGLNLSIKRIIFEATSKHDGSSFRTIRTSELKQIGGRAGRYRTAAQAGQDNSVADADITLLDVQQPAPKKKQTSIGLVTALEDFDMPIIRRAMSTDVQPLATAGIFPPTDILIQFAAYFPANTPFSYILLRLQEICSIHPRFHLCQYKEQIDVADTIQPYNLTIMERCIFIASPATLRDPGMIDVLKELAKCVSDQTGGELVDIKSINLELLDEEGGGKGHLRSLEALHKQLTLYLWLSYRFHGIFRSQKLAFHVKSLLEAKIDACLGNLELDSGYRKHLNTARERAAMRSRSPRNEPGEKEVEELPNLDSKEFSVLPAPTTDQAVFLDIPIGSSEATLSS